MNAPAPEKAAPIPADVQKAAIAIAASWFGGHAVATAALAKDIAAAILAARAAFEALPAPSGESVTVPRVAGTGIYVASKTRHAPTWQAYRERGWPINSTWIDEAGAGESGDLNDLWQRCVAEASSACVLVVYREADDVLKGGWVEVGAALASGVPVYAVGLDGFTIAHDKRIRHFGTLDDAMDAAARLAAVPALAPTADEGGAVAPKAVVNRYAGAMHENRENMRFMPLSVFEQHLREFFAEAITGISPSDRAKIDRETAEAGGSDG